MDASDATNAATANAAASAALLTAQRDPVLTVAQANQAVADANAAVTAAKAAAAIAPTELTEAVTAYTSAIAVQTAANAASNLSPADITLAGTQVSTSAAAVTLATTNAATATASVGAANAQLTIAIAAQAAVVAQANIPNNYFYSDVGLQNNTFTGATVINGAGAGTLNIKSSIVGAMSMGYGGQDWNVADSGFTNLNITNNLGAGAIRLVSSTAFNNTFNGGNLSLTTALTAIGAAGATTITLDGSIAGSVNYLGSATITATNNAVGNAGAIDILAGSGATIVNVATTAGEESAGGAGLTSVTMTSYGAGAQNVGTTGASASALANVHLTQLGAGAQTIISSNLSAVTVTAIMGTSSTAGAQTITTNAGSDTITLIDNGGFTGSVVLVNAGGGTNQIILAAMHTGVNTIINNSGSWTVGVNQTTAVDTIVNFASATDVIQISKAAYAGSYFGAVGSGNASNTHIGVIANTATAVNTAGSSLAGGQITLITGGALVLIGVNTPGNTLDVYAVDSSANAGNTIAQDIAAHTATLIGHVSIIGAPLTVVNFVSIG